MDWPLLSTLPAHERTAVLAAARTTRHRRGDFLFHEGDRADAMHLVVSGHVAVRSSSEDGGGTLLNVLGPGSLVGELSILPGGAPTTRSAAASCLDAVVTQTISATVFATLCDRHRGVERWLTGVLAERVRELSERVCDLMLVAAEDRMRRCLSDLAARFADLPGASPVIPLTQDQVAEFVGVTRPTANQLLRQLVADGVVRLDRGRLTVLRPEAL